MTFSSSLRSSLLFVALCLPAFSQDSASDSFVELSPFTISMEAAASTIVTPNSVYELPSVPVFITKKADAVAIQILLVNKDDKQELRNADLQRSVAAILSAFEKRAGLKVEQREIRFAGGNKKFYSSFSRDQAKDSYVNLVIFGALDAGNTTLSRLKEIRDTIQRISLVGKTTATDGVVGLYLKDPSQYRGEIIEKIFADLLNIKKHLGNDYEVMPSGMNRAVMMKVSGESELSLWVDYNFSIQSVRELSRPILK